MRYINAIVFVVCASGAAITIAAPFPAGTDSTLVSSHVRSLDEFTGITLPTREFDDRELFVRDDLDEELMLRDVPVFPRGLFGNKPKEDHHHDHKQKKPLFGRIRKPGPPAPKKPGLFDRFRKTRQPASGQPTAGTGSTDQLVNTATQQPEQGTQEEPDHERPEPSVGDPSPPPSPQRQVPTRGYNPTYDPTYGNPY